MLRKCFFLLFICHFVLFVGCRPEKEIVAPPQVKLTVSVVEPEVREIQDVRTFIGNVRATDTIEIQAEVTGELIEKCYESGAYVEKGAVLFRLDPTIYKAELDMAQADLATLEAQQASLKAEFDRAKKLRPDGALSEGDFEQAEADFNSCVAKIEGAKAKIDRAKFNLEHTEVKAPQSGTVSREFVSVGNLVNANTTNLARLVTVDPIHIYFDIDEATFLLSQKLMGKIPQIMFEVGEEGRRYVSTIDYGDPYLNQSSGTRTLRTQTANPPRYVGEDGQEAEREANLLSGMMVRVTMPISKKYTALLVPDACIMSEQDRKFVYTVDSENKIQIAYVQLGALQRDNMRVLTSGAVEGMPILTDSLLKVRPGMEVATQPKAAPQEAPKPAQEKE